MVRTAKPVQDIPLLMTRPAGSNRPFLDKIAPDLRRHLRVVTSPLIAIEALDPQHDINLDAGAIFTSRNGVAFAPRGRSRKAFCVGARTTQTAQEAGWDAVCAGADAASLVETLRHNAPRIDLHHFHGVHTRGRIDEQLNADGMNVSSVAVYDQTLLPLSQAAQDLFNYQDIVFVPLFSPRTASHFASLITGNDQTNIIAISEAVADECVSHGFKSVFVASEPNADSMVICLEKRLSEVRPA